jgi:phosphoribosylaminoimidazolecarboxamide formyltransferase/IMP cyclohydrolase
VGAIETALVSVFDKTGLEGFARGLAARGVRLLASGGTAAHLKQAGLACDDISRITGRVDLLGGLVKTLHPAVHAGILSDRSNPEHMKELAALGYPKIDLVVVNFYALPDSAPGMDLGFIDIGGPAMARAAAKNFRSCVPVPHPSWYQEVLAALESGGVGVDLRWRLATETLARTGCYDAGVLDTVGLGWRVAPAAGSLLLGMGKALDLRYGENPHQRAGFYTASGRSGLEVLKGELSYNNILDIDCATEVLRDFESKAAVVIKHVGPCGVAEGSSGAAALEAAYKCDPVSAFGGVVGVNFAFDADCAELLGKLFVECIVAPDFDEAALERLAKKKARLVKARPGLGGEILLRSAAGGVLAQERDGVLFKQGLTFAGCDAPGEEVVRDLVFAWKAVKHVRSNAIVLARGGRTLGIGAGQPSRVDSTRLAIAKAAQFGHDAAGSVLASDGFLPFPDSVELAAAAGVRAVVQPGGSIRDGEVMDAAARLGVAMATTSIRHFKH